MAANAFPALTTATLRRMEADPKTRALRKALAEAQKFALAERARVDAYVEPLFATFTFYRDTHAGDDGARIAKSKDVYMSKDDALAARFFAACLDAHAAHGWTGLRDFCPALVAEAAVTKAENAFLEHAETYLKVPFRAGTVQMRDRALALLTNPPRLG